MTYVSFTDKQNHGHCRPSFQFAKILTCLKANFIDTQWFGFPSGPFVFVASYHVDGIRTRQRASVSCEI